MFAETSRGYWYTHIANTIFSFASIFQGAVLGHPAQASGTLLFEQCGLYLDVATVVQTASDRLTTIERSVKQDNVVSIRCLHRLWTNN